MSGSPKNEGILVSSPTFVSSEISVLGREIALQNAFEVLRDPLTYACIPAPG